MKVIYDACQGQTALLTPQFTRRRPSESNKARVTAWGLSSLGRAEALPHEWQLKAKLRPVPMSVSSSAGSSAERHPRKTLSCPLKGSGARGKARFSLLELTQLGDEAGLRADSWWKDRASEPLDRSWRPTCLL